VKNGTKRWKTELQNIKENNIIGICEIQNAVDVDDYFVF